MAVIEKLDANMLWDMLREYVSKRGLIKKLEDGLFRRNISPHIPTNLIIDSLKTDSPPPLHMTSTEIKRFFDNFLTWKNTREGFEFWHKEQVIFASILYQLCPTDLALGNYVVKNLIGRNYGRHGLPQEYIGKIIMLYNIHNEQHKDNNNRFNEI